MFAAEMTADVWDIERFLPVFVNAARAVAGADASKIVVSDRLRELLDGAEEMEG